MVKQAIIISFIILFFFNKAYELTGLPKIVRDIRFMLGFGVSIYWKLTWCFIVPIFLLVIFIYAMIVYKPEKTDDGQPFPEGVSGKLLLLNFLINLNIYLVFSCRMGIGCCGDCPNSRMGNMGHLESEGITRN